MVPWQRWHPQQPTAVALLTLMDRKKTNLAIAADVTTKAELLRLADLLGPSICVLKTHIDIITDFDADLVERLKELAEKHEFLIFEDRKFADIGNTTHLQYTSGPFKIASWSHITNAHPIPGDTILHGLAIGGKPLGRGILLLAEMSTEGTLAAGAYTDQAVAMARRHRGFVIGFIGMRKLGEPDEDWIVMTPGVGLEQGGDGLGQVYRTPRQVVLESGCDVIIVGRGIYGGNRSDAEVVQRAELFREAGWKAYLERSGQ
ncbi:Orotidine 5'-phosphate decarboxylase [Zopfochytrium polystomum]|nr:Orotidine 5'-phosphate decarboxylase [Zopfochytrium polystomum]